MHSRGSSSSINHPAPLHVSLLHLTVDIDMQLSEAYYFRHVKLKDVFRILAILYVIFQYLFVLLAKSIFSGFAVFFNDNSFLCFTVVAENEGENIFMHISFYHCR